MRERLALYTMPYKGIKSYFEMVDIAKEHGLSKLEILNHLELTSPDIEFAKKLKEYADEKGITFPCVSVGIQLMTEDPTKRIEALKKYAEIAAILGSPYLHHTIAFSWENPDEVYSHRDEYFEKGIKAVREVYDYAQSIGVRVINEEQGFIFNGMENFKQYINEVDRNVGMVADFGNIQFVDEDLEPMISEFADRIVHAHVKDYRMVKEGDYKDLDGGYLTLHHNKVIETDLGAGSVNIKEIIEELNKIGYKGTIALEAKCRTREDGDILEQNILFMEELLK